MIIEPSQLAAELNDLLQDYTDEVAENVNESIKETADEAQKKIKTFNFGRKKWKQYPKGWRVNVTAERYKMQATVYNATDYQLTHLLEFGHATRNGGRTAAFPHIADVNEFAQQELVKKIKEKLS